jgi:Zn-finger protein
MARCEDYPCCGHEPGDCPNHRADGSEVWRCVECRKKLPRNARSSICNACLKRAERRFANGEDMFPDNDR